jgi:hypothetical protein
MQIKILRKWRKEKRKRPIRISNLDCDVEDGDRVLQLQIFGQNDLAVIHQVAQIVLICLKTKNI